MSECNECSEVVCGFVNCRTKFYTGLNVPYPVMNWVHLRAWYGVSSGRWNKRTPPNMEVSCYNYRYIEQIVVDSRKLAILCSIYLEIPSNIALNTAGNNDLALTLLLVPAERTRQHYDLCRIIHYFPQYTQSQSWKNIVCHIRCGIRCNRIYIKTVFCIHKNKKETDVNIPTHKCWKPSG